MYCGRKYGKLNIPICGCGTNSQNTHYFASLKISEG